MKLVKVGILGTGNIARSHAGNLARINNVEIAALCDIDMFKIQSFMSSIPGCTAKCFTEFGAMLDECDLDALYVCLPPFAHCGQVEEAAKKGIHIFIEKPIALTLERGANMVKHVKEAGVKSHVGFHMRFGSAVKRLKSLIESGDAGLPTLFDGRYECNALHSPWWRRRDKSGGQVFEQVIHVYDLAQNFLGIADTVTGFTGNLCHSDISDYTVEDTSVASIRFRSGALASVSGSNCAVPKHWNIFMTVVFKNLTAYFSNPNKAEFIFTGGEAPKSELFEEDCDSRFEESQAFISALRGMDQPLCTIEEGFRSLVLVDGVVRSAAEGGKPVRLEY